MEEVRGVGLASAGCGRGSEEVTQCCPMRTKVAIVPIVIPESACGIPDSALLDFADLSTNPTTLLTRFCPWCGADLRERAKRVTSARMVDGEVQVDVDAIIREARAERNRRERDLDAGGC